MSAGDAVAAPAAAELHEATRTLRLAVITSSVDRFSIAPMLLTIARDMHGTLASAGGVASAYFLAYGLSQLGWGALSDRIGRVRTMRITLGLAAFGALLSALAPNLILLSLARALTGAAFGAITPTSLVYIGDSFPVGQRHRALSDLAGATAIGSAAAIGGAGLAVAYLSWRAIFALPCLPALYLVMHLSRLPEPHHPAGRESPLRQFARVVRTPWALLVIFIALVEGGAVLGCLTYLAPAIESEGGSAALAGLVVAVWGVSVAAGSRLLRGPMGRSSPTGLMAWGGAAYVAGFAAVTISHDVVLVLLCAILLGLGWALMHPALQTWATDVSPPARATSISLFAASLFFGSALVTAVAGPLAEQHRYSLVFGGAAVVCLGMGALAAASRSRYRLSTDSMPADEVPGGIT